MHVRLARLHQPAAPRPMPASEQERGDEERGRQERPRGDVHGRDGAGSGSGPAAAAAAALGQPQRLPGLRG